MAIIAQQTLFVWDEIENLGDLERLMLIIEYMPDEALMNALEESRGNGRNDYPIRAMWNSILAGVVFQHTGVESLRRELARNSQLRLMCGFHGTARKNRGTRQPELVPPAWAYTRFLKNILLHQDLINAMFEELVVQLRELLPEFGKDLAIDSKAIDSLANGKSKSTAADGRRDLDANWGRKEYKGTREDGSAWSKMVKWFGYKLHLIVDSNYELPVAFSVTKASESDIKEGHKLIEKMEKSSPEALEACETLSADRGYDDTKLNEKLYDQHKIKPVIDIRNMWKDGEATRRLEGYDNVVYDYKGRVYCHCLETDTRREMAVGGFEKDRGTLKKLCPAKQYGTECKCMGECLVKGAIRIPIKLDRRVFTPIDRASYKWEKNYNKRTSVERVNSRLDVSFGFERHYIRGIAKMEARCGIALCVMLAIAVGRITQKQEGLMRSLVKSSA